MPAIPMREALNAAGRRIGALLARHRQTLRRRLGDGDHPPVLGDIPATDVLLQQQIPLPSDSTGFFRIIEQ